MIKPFNFITAKKVLYVANVSEEDITTENNHVKNLKEYLNKTGDDSIQICARIEEELSSLSNEEKNEYLQELGINEPGLSILTKQCFSLLGLQTYYTSGEKESRAWAIPKNASAPQAAGVIHTDFEKGFISAKIISYQDFIEFNGWDGAQQKGKLRQEGKTYTMQEGDIVEFLFNV